MQKIEQRQIEIADKYWSEQGYRLKIVLKEDAAQVKQMYQKISKDMYTSGIRIWNYDYPCRTILSDIQKGQLFGVYWKEKCAGAFALCKSDNSYESIGWALGKDAPVYCERVAVSLDFRGQGLGVYMYHLAASIAAQLGYDSLRALVVDCNIPAIKLCENSGMQRRPGLYSLPVGTNKEKYLIEYGFEMTL